MFPLGKTGGLIEATGQRQTNQLWYRFRWVKPAASLKRAQTQPRRWRAPCFRWVKPAASLKRGVLWYRDAPVGGFPLGKTGGLIEAAASGGIVPGACAGFRWVKPAASLKRGGVVGAGADPEVVSAG